MNFLKTIIDFVFPERCLNCQKASILICENCLNSLDLNEKELESFIYTIFDYRNPIMKKIIWNLKYKNKKQLSIILANYLYPRILEELSELKLLQNFNKAILIPIPLSKKRLKERGYNQSLLIGKNLEKLDKKENFVLNENILYKNKETEHQAHIKNKQERLKNLINTFEIRNKDLIKTRNIILIDDVTTTEATLKETKKALKKNGANKIIAFTVAH